MPLRSAALSLAALLSSTAMAQARECVQSPGKTLEVCVDVVGGRAVYTVARKGTALFAPSELGLRFEGEQDARFTTLTNPRRGSVDTSWEQPWGEQRRIRDRHNALTVTLGGDTPLNRAVDVTFRVFEDGIGFRYGYAVPAGQAVKVSGERTQFRPIGAYQAWWYSALGAERDEYLYSQTDARRITLAETPLTLKGANGVFLSFHEAALVDFPSMLIAGNGTGTLSASLMPWPSGEAARKTGPFTTPWRTILIGETPGDLADSRIELNLNEANKLGDVAWFKPGKYVGVWWEMHLKHSTWGSGYRHGANTENVKRYIDFAAKNGFDGVLVEGWNLGWDGDWIANGDKFSFTKAYPDFDAPGLAAYAKAKGVQLIGHNETGGAVVNYESQLEDAMAFYEKLGVHVVKTGYVKNSGEILDAEGGKQWFAGQYMVRHNLHVAEVAAKHRVAIDAHEPVKDTGLRRTWPNMISREGARGQEYNAWGVPTNPPEHLTILPFTRMLAGPMDFTPGIFDLAHGQNDVTLRVQSTLTAQLAEYVVLYSPVQMAADLPENYEAQPAAFQFIRDVPTDWETTRTLQSDIGNYVVVARQQRGRGDWYLGAITDEVARTLEQRLDFLAPGKRYEAQIYRDGEGADYRTNPTAYRIEKRTVTSADTLTLVFAPGGGTAVRFRLLN
ncbi:glycoside hydrolase family 97 protein [Sphingomonas sp. MMS12-HWE2-04]|uniref:glycoside hydrolase family 97 protein n=1 Tax=Sphingomonas sp. MMS12-HWE2-04 TaxID=3234199 RepID=UPI00384DC916